MNLHATRMTVPEFLAWAEKQPRGRYELWNGQPVEMSPERVGHIKAKRMIANLLEDAARRVGLDCHVLGDGATVRIDERTAYEPDALVYYGPELPNDAVIVPAPVIVVEILSPGAAKFDTGAKLEGYFSLPSVMHYLIVDAERRVVTHLARRQTIETTIIRDGQVRLDPPGFAFDASPAFV
jgi:Uma2 family endonuclease